MAGLSGAACCDRSSEGVDSAGRGTGLGGERQGWGASGVAAAISAAVLMPAMA